MSASLSETSIASEPPGVASPSAAADAARAPRHILALDGSRGVAALFVVIAHYGYFQCGWISVQYFFVLSGFLITSILMQARARPLKSYLRNFYWRRSLRIFPLYFAYLAVCTVAYLWWREPASFADGWKWLYSYTYNLYLMSASRPMDRFFAHLWSLSAEEQFYVVWPFVVFFARGRALKWLLLSVLVLIPLGRLAFHLYAVQQDMRGVAIGRALYMGTMFQFDGFAAGAAIAVFGLERWKGALRWFVVLALLTLAYGIFAMVALPTRGASQTVGPAAAADLIRNGWSFGFPLLMVPRAQYLWGYSLTNLISTLFIISLCQRNALSRWLENRFLCYVGAMSYGVYVLHSPLQHFYFEWFDVDPRSLRGVLLLAPMIALVLGAAHVSFAYFERRFLALKGPRLTA